MKKHAIWTLAGVLLFGTLAACGPQATPEPVVTEPPATEPPAPTAMPLVELVVWADELRAPIFTAQAAAAEELGIQLTVQQMGFGDIRDQLAIAGPAGEGPDLIIGAHDWLGQLVVNGLLSPIDLGELGSEFLPAALDAFTYEGQLYGVPYATENVAFFCNPDVVETAPVTWDDVTALAEELEAESGGAVTAWTIQTSDPYHYFPLMSSFGGYVFAATDEGYDPSDVGLDSPGAMEAAAWLQSMAEAGHLKPDVDYDVMHAQFEGGQVGCIGTGPWALNRIRESGVAYTINPYPAGSAGPGQPLLGVQGLMISAFSENQLLAQTFLTEIVATEEFMQAMYDADPRPSALLAVREATVDADLAAFAAAGEEGLPMPAIPEMSSVWEAWANAISLTITQQSTGEDAFTTAAEQIRTAIAQ